MVGAVLPMVAALGWWLRRFRALRARPDQPAQPAQPDQPIVPPTVTPAQLPTATPGHPLSSEGIQLTAQSVTAQSGTPGDRSPAPGQVPIPAAPVLTDELLQPGSATPAQEVRAWLSLAAVLVAGTAVVVLLPGVGAPGGAAPGAATLLSVGLVMTIFTVGALLFALRSALGYPWKVVLTAAGYNVVIVLVKFTLAPAGLYEVNAMRPLGFELGATGGALWAAFGVFAFVDHGALPGRRHAVDVPAARSGPPGKPAGHRPPLRPRRARPRVELICATSLNDVADRDVDRVNHPNSTRRPLVCGEATVADLYLVHAVAASAAVGLAAVLGTFPFLLMLLSLAINYAYSAGPLRLSYRTYLAPLVLAVAYVLIPGYWG